MEITSFVGELLEEDDVDLLRDGVRGAQAVMEAEVRPPDRSGALRAVGIAKRLPQRLRTRNWDTRVSSWGTRRLAALASC
jgi:hypothetical protein